jgi:3-oxoacyl-(acyl-carrier-protein) synthase
MVNPLDRSALVAAEASTTAVAAVSVHGTGTALGALAIVLHVETMLTQHVIEAHVMLCGHKCRSAAEPAKGRWGSPHMPLSIDAF